MDTVDLFYFCDKYRVKENITGAENLESLSLKVVEGSMVWTPVTPVKEQTTYRKDQFGRSSQNGLSTFTNSRSAVKSETVTINRGLVKGIYTHLKLPCKAELKKKFGDHISIDPCRQCYNHEDRLTINTKHVYSNPETGWTCTYAKDTLHYKFECRVQCLGEVIFMNVNGSEQDSITGIVRTVEPTSSLLESGVLSWKISGEYSYADITEPI
ncbi:uncharacterized protein LOC131935830 isoform X2 [Physella acuta]|uniref:uncharacterized protein LOC131935830 isoform X2 n=2 Tax=Physella acuta TaxID=109671 RepID=UPI0027DB4750|nr:uncharacterized protein LOC131935830 isoform X2 [Physella acuta]